MYEDRYKADGMMHDFRIDFMENRYAKVFLEDGKQVKCRKCKIQEVMSLDLRINTKRFMGIRESHWVCGPNTTPQIPWLLCIASIQNMARHLGGGKK